MRKYERRRSTSLTYNDIVRYFDKITEVLVSGGRGCGGGDIVGLALQSERSGTRYLPPPCCVIEQRHIYSPKSTGNTQEAVAPSRHD